MISRRSALLVALGCLLTSAAAQADGPSADEIARHLADSSAFSWEGARTQMTMRLADKDGTSKTRKLVILGRRQNGLLQTVVRFVSPADIAGTAFLMLEREGGRSEQHIYLPGLKRTRRIAGREREGSFVGSDFTYSDLRRADAKDAAHTRLADENVGETQTLVIESVPKQSARSMYSKVTTWVRKSDLVPLRTQFMDRSSKLLKTLFSKRIRKIDGRPIIAEAHMRNEQTGHTTDIVVEAIERRSDLADSQFTPAALEH